MLKYECFCAKGGDFYSYIRSRTLFITENEVHTSLLLFQPRYFFSASNGKSKIVSLRIADLDKRDFFFFTFY